MQDIKAVVSELRAQERRLAQRGRDLGGGGGPGSPKKGSGAVKGGPGGAAAAAARLQQREADLLAREEQHWRRATALERREAQISKQLRVLREQEVPRPPSADLRNPSAESALRRRGSGPGAMDAA